MDLDYNYECDLCRLKEELEKYSFIEKVHHNDSHSSGKKGSQYEGLHWIRCKFNTEVQSEYVTIYGFHIMPYSIKKEDIENNGTLKIVKNVTGEKKFNESDDDFTDYDLGSGNMHKKPDGTYQIVLITDKVKPYGPGWSDNGAPNIGESPSDFYSHIKKDWYFPNFFDRTNEVELKDVDAVLQKLDGFFKELGIKK